jgi:hypothetical protein
MRRISTNEPVIDTSRDLNWLVEWWKLRRRSTSSRWKISCRGCGSLLSYEGDFEEEIA